MKFRVYNPGKDYFDRLEQEYQDQHIPLADKIIAGALAAVGIAFIYLWAVAIFNLG